MFGFLFQIIGFLAFSFLLYIAGVATGVNILKKSIEDKVSSEEMKLGIKKYFDNL